MTDLLKWRSSGLNWPLRIMLTSSIPAVVDAADAKLLDLSIGLVRLDEVVVLLDEIVEILDPLHLDRVASVKLV